MIQVGELHLEQITIPSMIIQPYVENAVKHGLLHKAGKKELKLSFITKDQHLFIGIEDNGIGRQKSAHIKMRQEKFINHLLVKQFRKELNL